MNNNQTVPGIGPGAWDSAVLAREQEEKAKYKFASDPLVRSHYFENEPVQSKDQSNAIVYRLYTEAAQPGLLVLISRYFSGATILYGSGLWLGKVEAGAVIEILATSNDLQSIIHLAGDIKVQNHQSSVLVTWAPVSQLDV